MSFVTRRALNVRPLVVSGTTTLGWADLRPVTSVIVSAACTVTLPTPIKAMAGIVWHVANTSSGTVTLSCSSGVISGSTFTISTKESALVGCMQTAATEVYKWVPFCLQAGMGVTETTQDVAAAMWTGGTHTGLSVSYNDTTGVIDATVALGAWATWSPTVVWNDAAPASVTAVYRYRYVGTKGIEFMFDLSGTDGDAKTLTSISAPVEPADINSFTPFACSQLQNTTWTVRAGYLDQEHNTAGSRVLKGNFAACTDTEAWRIIGHGFYEIA